METYIDRATKLVAEKTHLSDGKLVRFYTLLVLTKGEDITLSDVHDAWAVNMNFKPTTDRCFGHEHHSLVPFEELPKESQKKDVFYVEALKKAARLLKTGQP
jgi:hypothetical protein